MSPRRTPTDEPLDPGVAAELEALEAALNGSPGADPELVALVADVRDSAAPMPRATRRRLDERVAAGFPRRRPRLPSLPGPRKLVPALAVGAIALGVAGVALRAAHRDNAETPSGSVGAAKLPHGATATGGAPATTSRTGVSGTPGVHEDAHALPQAAAPALKSLRPTDSDLTALHRSVQRDIQLTLRVGRDDLQDASDGVVRATQTAGGYVQTSDVGASDHGGTASFTLRVPTARLDDAIKALSKLGHVAELDQQTQDITASVDDARTLLADAKRERRALLRALDKATTPGRIASLRSRIADNRSEIASRQEELDGQRRRANLATIDLTVRASTRGGAAPAAHDKGGWGAGDALDAAGDIGRVAAAVALLVVIVGVPLALVGAALAAAGRELRRRRREQALRGT